VTLGFQQEPLALNLGAVAIRGQVNHDEPPPPVLPLRLTIQACDDEKCLAPEDLGLEVPAALLFAEGTP